MSKRARQYIGILAAVVVYYLVHEGAHLLYALFAGVFKQINFMGIGVQIDVYAGRMSEAQLGAFCLAGAVATFCGGYALVALAGKICCAKSKLLRAALYYITIAFLLLDPLYRKNIVHCHSGNRLFISKACFKDLTKHLDCLLVECHFQNLLSF